MKLSEGNNFEDNVDKNKQVEFLKSELASREHFYHFLTEEEAKLTNRLLDSQLTRRKLEKEIEELKELISSMEK